ncbi:hypothetical protein GCM10011611_12360 [Aliidongia dinghuensis]|uniref:Uncharacterized protein n=1 Tax=Aliidongia dinghuensis TaxID=1867774 RepID=A0A8J2YS21_9PROT|nr:hypothetical protein [Aliidongia dinghuensis]GGF08456.1 hypothetical protein GCM10011611_12360 [Aliidongia dinghuensis]
MKHPLIAAFAVLVAASAAAPALAQSAPPGAPSGPPPDFNAMRAEHDRFEAAWAQCRTIADGTTRATCYEKLHDDLEAARAQRHGHGDRPPPQ